MQPVLLHEICGLTDSFRKNLENFKKKNELTYSHIVSANMVWEDVTYLLRRFFRAFLIDKSQLSHLYILKSSEGVIVNVRNEYDGD